MLRFAILHDRRGASALEYALLAALIAIAGIMAFDATGDGVSTTMTKAGDAMPSSGTGAPPKL